MNRRVDALAAAGAARRIAAHDATLWGGDTARAASVSNRLGWTNIASLMREQIPMMTSLAEVVKADGYTDAVLFGMGGSSLAPEVLRQSIVPKRGYPRLHVLDTTDPATIAGVVRQIDPARTLFFVSSKSGTTIEALSLFAYFHALVSAAKGDRAGENFVAVTDAGTPLQALAAAHTFRHIFTNPADIGGRYSALSFFGLAPAAVCGVDGALLIDRAIAAERATATEASDAMRLGALLGEMALASRNKATFIVSPEIASFGLWVEQLIAESTGKLGIGILPVAGEPFGRPETYGDDRFFVHLRLAGGSNDAGDAMITALTEAGFPVATIGLDDAYDLGREFVRWEFATAVSGHVLGINPFDEPNVQESKDNTGRVLREYAETRTLDAATAGAKGLLALTPDGVWSGMLPDAVTALLGGAPGDGYVAITAYVEPTAIAEAAFTEIRGLIRDATRQATTLGFGPRYLHSTGQLHKGGPPQGVFLQVTANDAADLAIPDQPFTFGQLKRAQAIGDFESLASHGRPVLRVHLGDDIEGGLAQLVDAVRAAEHQISNIGG